METEVLQWQAKECQESQVHQQKLEEARAESVLQVLEGSMALLIGSFQTFRHQTWETTNSFCFKPRCLCLQYFDKVALGNLYTQIIYILRICEAVGDKYHMISPLTGT